MVSSCYSDDGTVSSSDMDRVTDSREKGRIGIFGTTQSYAGSSGRVTHELIGRDLNPLGRGDGNAYVAGALNLGRISPRLPQSSAYPGTGNSVNNCGQCGGGGYSGTGLPTSGSGGVLASGIVSPDGQDNAAAVAPGGTVDFNCDDPEGYFSVYIGSATYEAEDFLRNNCSTMTAPPEHLLYKVVAGNRSERCINIAMAINEEIRDCLQRLWSSAYTACNKLLGLCLQAKAADREMQDISKEIDDLDWELWLAETNWCIKYEDYAEKCRKSFLKCIRSAVGHAGHVNCHISYAVCMTKGRIALAKCKADLAEFRKKVEARIDELKEERENKGDYLFRLENQIWKALEEAYEVVPPDYMSCYDSIQELINRYDPNNECRLTKVSSESRQTPYIEGKWESGPAIR